MITPDIRSYLSRIGRNGGLKSRRGLSRQQARLMVAVRLARIAYRDFRVQCFWSYRDLVITAPRVRWVADQLRRNGNRTAWQRAAQIEKLLCP